ncbi:MAG: FHA domain-containing protein [Desulfobacteraceae bacterium]|nr:FHA domain-containing protein [Desulfobacteraceae bacterium]
MLKIKVFENAHSFFEKEFPTDADVKVGRGEHCDLLLRSKRVSREHCRLFFQNGLWQAEDFKSQNGIRLNGAKILSEKLQNGDNLQVGDHRLEIMLPPNLTDLPDMADMAGDQTVVRSLPEEDDRTVLLGSSEASDLTVVRSIDFSDDKTSDGGIGKAMPPFFKNKRLMAAAFGIIFVLLIIVLISASSNDTPDPEKVLLPAEQKKAEAMLDMEGQHRIRVYLQSGKELFDTGNYNEALVRFQAVLRVDTENETALTYISQCREKIIEVEEQKQAAAEEEQKQKMERVATITSRARQAFLQSDYTNAMEIISEAAFLAPNDLSVTSLQAEIGSALENEKTQNKKSLHQKEENMAKIKQHFDLGQQYYDQEKYHEALQEWDQVLATGMDTPETAHVRHAVVHIKTLLEDDVRNDYDKGITYFKSKDYTRAVSYLQKVSQVLPGYQDTEKILAEAINELESQAKKLFQEGLVYEGIGQNKKAAVKWREVLKVMPVESNKYYQKSLEKLQ